MNVIWFWLSKEIAELLVLVMFHILLIVVIVIGERRK